MSNYGRGMKSLLDRITAPAIQANSLSKGPRVTVLGTRRAGKSTVLGLLHITLVMLANERKLRYRISEYDRHRGQYETVLHSAQSADMMRRGYFPKATEKGQTFEADATIVFPKKNVFGQETTVNIPFIDIAGEEIAIMLNELNNGTYNMPELPSMGRQLYEKILCANGFILIVPCHRMEEKEEDELLYPYADVNLRDLISVVYDYKKLHQSAQKINSICVMFTQYDKVVDRLLERGIDLRTDAGRDVFMSEEFPETYSILNFFGLDHVKFIPSWVQEAGMDETIFVKDKETGELYSKRVRKALYDADGKPMIQLLPGKRMPDFPIPSYVELVNWIKDNFP